MSTELGLTTRALDLPTARQWSDAAQSSGYDVAFEAFDWNTHTGYLPTKFCGRPSGFELYREPVTRKALLGPKPTGEWRVTLRLGIFEHEVAAALVALEALLAQVGGNAWNDDADTWDPTELQDEARGTYLKWRFLLARESVGPAGLPFDQPPINEKLETIESRVSLVQKLCDQQHLNPAEAEGWYRLHKTVQDQLDKDRNMRGLE